MWNKIQLALRWSARVTGLLLVGFFLLFVVGHGGLPNVFRQPVRVQVEFLGLFLCLAGFLVGWRWEGLGGLVAAGGFVAFCATELIVNGRPPGGAIPLFAVPAVLFLASAAFNRVCSHRASSHY